ncbi:acyltransferase family protein [Paenibacillus sp. HJGM_3]|uniref:acyltransferase family protein n=1 Tax=Paenibacillus sp. HJGM_3 TaxID=3379816 RepID=UPI00385E59C7
MAGLDGLRALSVFAVIAYHLHAGWAQGGLLGVGVFFVLSGYLITDILADQWGRHRTIDLKDFWMRRIRRLMPAMLVMIGAVLAWATMLGRTQLSSIREDAMASVLYVMNWWYVYHEVSYFESFGPPSPLGHLWSLAVEEQFYLVWPIVFMLLLRFVKRRGRIILLLVAGIAASAVAMAVLYEPGLDPSRVYYGTDTRAFALLIGALLALVWPSRRLATKLTLRSRTALDMSGTVALFTVGLLVWRTNEYDAGLYQGGMVVLSIAAAVLVAVLAHPASLLAKVLGSAPLKWLGQRSYGIYLWHYPVIILTSPSVQSEELNVVRAAVQVTATLILAALSYRLVEEPIRQGSMGKLWRRILTGDHKRPFRPGRLWVTSAGTLLALLMLGGGTSGWSPFMDGNAVSVAGGVHPSDTGTPTPLPLPTPTAQPTPDTAAKPTPTPGGSSSPVPTPTPTMNPPNGGTKPTPTPAASPGSGKGITVIGDSVILDAGPYLEKLLPGIHIEGKIGRQMAQAPELINQLKADGNLGSRVLIELGTNGSFSKKQLDTLFASLKGVQHIVLVNTRVPRPWEEEVNNTLASYAATCSNVTLVDWHTASKDKSELFYDDGVHLNPEGAEFYASLLAQAFEPVHSTGS